MKIKKIRLAAILLVMVMLVSGVLTGCSKKEYDEDDYDSSEEVTEEIEKGNPDELFSQYWENGVPEEPRKDGDYYFDIVGYLKACGCEDVEITTEGTVNGQAAVVFYENGWRCEIGLFGNPAASGTIVFGDGPDCSGAHYAVIARDNNIGIRLGSNGERTSYRLIKVLPYFIKTLRLYEYNPDEPKAPNEFKYEMSFTQEMRYSTLTTKLSS